MREETVIRICPDSGLPVVALHEGGGVFLCLHNDTPEQDAQAVRNWVASNGRNHDPDRTFIRCRQPMPDTQP
jgi:hypothetical protein